MSDSVNSTNFNDSFENGNGGPDALDFEWQNGGNVVDLIVGHNNPDLAGIAMAMYQAAMDNSFNDGWIGRGGYIQLHEEAANAAGRALGHAEGEKMGVNHMNIAREQSFAHGFSSGYKAARSDSLDELTANLNRLVAANVAPGLIQTLENVVVDAANGVMWAEQDLSCFPAAAAFILEISGSDSESRTSGMEDSVGFESGEDADESDMEDDSESSSPDNSDMEDDAERSSPDNSDPDSEEGGDVDMVRESEKETRSDSEKENRPEGKKRKVGVEEEKNGPGKRSRLF